MGDTWGRVRLFTSPASQPRTLGHTYTGHSSQVHTSDNDTGADQGVLQVSSVSWTLDGTKLLSVGGKDTAVLQWSLQ